jgi:tryptophan-rich sensory protein
MSSAITGWFISGDSIGWYHTLNHPSFSPPDRLFGPVWTVLYIMIGSVGGLLWQERSESVTLFCFFIAQLFFNLLWSPLFFIGEHIGWAFVDIVALWISLLILIVLAYFKKKLIAWLLFPYFGWVSFAGALNFFLWRLN